MKPVSIVIITLNEQKRISRLLSDLVVQNYRNFEVIVVDSASDDLTVKIAKTYEPHLPSLRVHNMGTRGVSLGRNTGVKLAQHDRVLFLDADTRLEPNFLAQAMKDINQRQLDVAGVYRNVQKAPLKFKAGYGVFNAGLFLSQFFFPTAVGACLFSTKTVHQKIGGFDEEIELCEDCDYVKRAAKISRYRMLSHDIAFEFDPRRLVQDGYLSTGALYLRANVRRLILGEMHNQEIPYPFGHYREQSR